jgi:hypothetical protein
MTDMKAFERFFGALNDCLARAYNEATGVDVSSLGLGEMDRPQLTFAMISDTDVRSDEKGMVEDIQAFFNTPVADHPVNLHLHPGMFEVGLSPAKDDMTVVRLEHPTHIAVFAAVENYYRSLGAPDTFKQFVEGAFNREPISDVWGKEDMTVFMGS